MLSNILLVVHMIIAITIVVLVLLQQGKGADMGAAFGGGSSQSLFGARGSANFLSRLTSALVAFFFLTSLVLAFVYTRQGEEKSILEGTVVQQLEKQTSDSSEVTDETAQSIEKTASGQSDVPAIPE